jgi:hypothetical protein
MITEYKFQLSVKVHLVVVMEMLKSHLEAGSKNEVTKNW